MSEALRYLNNAKEILKSVPVEDNTYTDVKPVRKAFGTAYLAILEAINEYLQLLNYCYFTHIFESTKMLNLCN